jgi:hypothetical protein
MVCRESRPASPNQTIEPAESRVIFDDVCKTTDEIVAAKEVASVSLTKTAYQRMVDVYTQVKFRYE